MYVSLNTWDELPDGQNYSVYLVGTLAVEDYGDIPTRVATEKRLLQIAAALSECRGLLVANAATQPESDITLDHLHNLARWNLDYISLQDQDGHVFAGLDI